MNDFSELGINPEDFSTATELYLIACIKNILGAGEKAQGI